MGQVKGINWLAAGGWRLAVGGRGYIHEEGNFGVLPIFGFRLIVSLQ